MGRQARVEAFKERHGKCAQCAATEELTIDHVYPRSKGGSDHEDNWQVLCKPCNERKADSVPSGLRAPPKRKRRRRPGSPAVPATVAFSDLHPSVQSMLWR